MDVVDLGAVTPGDGPPRFLHAADLHLGASVHTKQAFANLLSTASQERVDFVVLAGDVYDSAERSANLQKLLIDGLARLSDAGVHVFIAHGNHDPVATDFRPVVGEMPERVHVFGSGDPQSYRLQVGTWTVVVSGLSFETKHTRENLAARIAATRVPADLRVAVLHANLEGQSGHDPYAPCVESDLYDSDIDYWALGHIHLRQVKQMGSGRWWAYPGNLQGRSTKPAERGQKGVLVVEADGAGFREPEFVPCDVHRFLQLDVPLHDVEHYGDAVDVVVEHIGEAFEHNGRRSLNVKVRLEGETDAHDDLASDLDRESLQELVDNPQIEVERVTTATRRPVNRQQLAQGKDLVAALLGRLDHLRSPEAAQELTELIARTEGFAGRHAVGRVERMDELGDLDHNDLLGQVEALILDRLVVEE